MSDCCIRGIDFNMHMYNMHGCKLFMHTTTAFGYYRPTHAQTAS